MPRHNLSTNPALKNNVTGWGGGSTPAQATGVSGAPSGRTTAALYTSGTFAQVAAGAASPGLDYTISVEIHPNGSGIGSGTFYVAFTRSAGGDDFSHTFALGSITANTWARVGFTATAPANTTGVYLIIDGVNFASLGGGQGAHITALLYEQASSVGSYFDGDSPSGSWDGTNGNSTSTLADAGVSPAGIAVPVALGQPTVTIPGASPTGIAVPVALGQPAAGPTIVTSGVTTFATVADALGRYFGGSYQAATHDYRTAPGGGTNVAGLALVRRGFAKRLDYADFFAGAGSGAKTGAWMAVWTSEKRRRRLTVPAVQGRKHVAVKVELHVFVFSEAPYAEECNDYLDTIDAAIVALLEADPTCGTGGLEVGQFHIGEADQWGGGPDIRSVKTECSTEDNVTKGKLEVFFEAHAVDFG